MDTIRVECCHVTALVYGDHKPVAIRLNDIKDSTHADFTMPTESELNDLPPRLDGTLILDQDDEDECYSFDKFSTKTLLHPGPPGDDDDDENMEPVMGMGISDLQCNRYSFVLVGTDEHNREVWAGLVRRPGGLYPCFYSDAPGRAMVVFLAVEDARRLDGTGDAYTSNVRGFRHIQFAECVTGSTFVEKYCFLYETLLRMALYTWES